jgi:hypothetical protein
MTERRVSPETLKKLKPGLSAAEVQEILEADPIWVEARKDEDRELRQRKLKNLQAEAPLLEELGKVGLELDSVWVLVNQAEPYPEALPILLEHLQRPYPDRVREGMARALAVRDARFGWDVLTRLYRHADPDSDVKEGLAVALAEIADDEVLDELLKLVQDSRQGSTRLHLLSGLEGSSDPRVRAALREVESDPQLGEAVHRILNDSP